MILDVVLALIVGTTFSRIKEVDEFKNYANLSY